MKKVSKRILIPVGACLIVAAVIGTSLFFLGKPKTSSTVETGASNSIEAGASTTVEAEPNFADPKTVTAKSMASYMGIGTNLGNTFEMDLNAKDYETLKEIVDNFIKGGFSNIRIPVNYGGREEIKSGRADVDGNLDLNNEDLKTLKLLVNYVLNDVNPKRAALGQKPIILIVDTHHEEWAMHDLIGSDKYEKNVKRLENIWTGICTLFKDAPDTLIFEFYNEPHFEMQLGDAAQQSVVDMNKRFYNIIRNFTVDGKKPHEYRKLLFGGCDWNSIWGLVDTYKTADTLPGEGKDKYIIGTYHFYNEIEKAVVSMDDAVTKFQKKYDIPVHMGEFGVDHKGDITDTVRQYYKTMAQEALKRSFAISVWDDNGWFQVYNRDLGTFNVLQEDTLGDKAVKIPPKVVLALPTEPYSLPGQIEAELYHAMNGVQDEPCTDEGRGRNIGYFHKNDWLEYKVNVETAGSYKVEIRMAGLNPIGTLQLQKDGADIATITPPSTGAWQKWETVTIKVDLKAGEQTLRFFSKGSEFNINWIKFTK